MTPTQNAFKCPSPRDNVDTKSWLAYEQNPYSTHWVRSSSCHREMSLGYDILHVITRLWADTNVNLTSSCCDNTLMIWARGLHNLTTASTTLSCSAITSMTQQRHHQHDLATTSRHGQVASVAPSLAWLGSTIASMTQHQHRTMAKLPR
jgi:hypothetical protein